MSPSLEDVVARLVDSGRHLVIGGSLDGRWIVDAIEEDKVGGGYKSKRDPDTSETWRVVEFRLGRAMTRRVWILRAMTEAEAFDRLIAAYRRPVGDPTFTRDGVA